MVLVGIPLLAALSFSAPVADRRVARLTNWLAVNGATLGPIQVAKSKIGDGAGAFTTRAVEEDELLFELPMNLCIGLQQAVEDEDVGEVLGKLCERGQGGATVALAGFLAKEWLCEGEDGAYGPYLAMLPCDAYWPPEG